MDNTVFLSLGKCEFANRHLDQSERAFLKSRELGAAAPSGSEELARIHIKRGDQKGSLVYLAEALRAESKRADLWFLQAETATAALNPELAMDSYERGIALGGPTLKQRTALIAMYIQAGMRDKALQHARTAAADLPKDVHVNATYADFYEQLNQPDEALALWRRAIDVDQTFELGHFHIASLLIAKSDAAGAFAATGAAIDADAASPRAYLIRADASRMLGDVYQRRVVLQEAIRKFPDTGLFRAAAETEDQFSGGAAAAWSALVSSLDKSRAPQEEILAALRHGMLSAVRDADAAQVDRFSHELMSFGDSSFASALVSPPQQEQQYLVVPGGINALACTRLLLAKTTRGLSRNPPRKGNQSSDACPDRMRRLAATVAPCS
jgi:tetratricopeptide (TPR) repeat protein